MELSSVDTEGSIQIIQGDSYTFTMNLWSDKPNSVPFDPTGWNIIMRVARSLSTSPAIFTLALGAGLEIVTATSAITTIRVTFSIEQTKALKPQTYFYQIEYFDGLPDGSTKVINNTFMNSTLTILEQVRE